MPDSTYTDDELERYFSDPDARRRRPGNGAAAAPPSSLSPHWPRPSRRRPGPEELERRARKLLRGAAIALGALLALGLLAALVLLPTLPSTELIENPEHLETTVVYTTDGQELARYYLGQNRTWVSADSISEAVFDALVALEDRRFYRHWGVDFRAFAASAAGLLRGERLRGASTITMQLARNLYDQIGTERSPIRKAREILTAIQIERRYTKREIIEMYLNTVPWSYNAFGIEAASRTYFNKRASRLEVPEAATLVAMLKGPSAYNPVHYPERATARRNLVMAEMVEEGYLSPERYAELRGQPIELDFRPYSHTTNLAPHFAEILRKWLQAWGRENGYDIYTDGLVVYSTIDSRIQALATEAVEEQTAKLQAVADIEWAARAPFTSSQEDAYLEYARKNTVEPWAYFWQSQGRLLSSFITDTDRFRALRREGLSPQEALESLRDDEVFMDSLRTAKTRLEAGLVALEPATGYVKAWVGGRDFVADKFDHVRTARRQSGSTFKPFVYVAAIDNGYSPYYRVMDSTFVWAQPGQAPWVPRNAGATSGGYVTLRTALSQSKNIPTARLTREVGPRTVKTYAERLGIESPLEAVPSIGLGVADVTLLEMVAAYATLAAGGLHHEPVMVTRIEDRQGNVLAEFGPRPREALNSSTAYTVLDMMRAVVDEGTGQRIRWKFGLRDYDFAGKTGTTQESADGWFILMHPDLVTGAWVGWNDRRIAFRRSWWGQGAHNALHVVGDFTRRLADSPDRGITLSTRRFEQPASYAPPPPPAPPEEEMTPVQRLLERWQRRDQEAAPPPPKEAPSERDRSRRGRVGW